MAQLQKVTNEADRIYQKEKELDAAYKDVLREKKEVSQLLIVKDEQMQAI